MQGPRCRGLLGFHRLGTEPGSSQTQTCEEANGDDVGRGLEPKVIVKATAKSLSLADSLDSLLETKLGAPFCPGAGARAATCWCHIQQRLYGRDTAPAAAEHCPHSPRDVARHSSAKPQLRPGCHSAAGAERLWSSRS